MMRTRRPEPAPINGGEANYLGSTPPEAYLHPDRRMPTPARAGRVKACRTFAATPAARRGSALIRPSTMASWTRAGWVSVCARSAIAITLPDAWSIWASAILLVLYYDRFEMTEVRSEPACSARRDRATSFYSVGLVPGP